MYIIVHRAVGQESVAVENLPTGTQLRFRYHLWDYDLEHLLPVFVAWSQKMVCAISKHEPGEELCTSQNLKDFCQVWTITAEESPNHAVDVSVLSELAATLIMVCYYISSLKSLI